jgi:hypothetical protein
VTSTLKLDEEKSKHASMAQENGFGPAYVQGMLSPVSQL